MFRRRNNTKKHECTLNIGSDSMLPKSKGKNHPCHNFLKLNLIAVIHPESERYFVSYPAIVAERQRQLIEGGPWLIHPFSLLSLIWNSIMAFVNLAFIIIAPWRFSYVFPTEPAVITISDYLLLPLRIMIFIDIIIKFNMGYKDYSESDIVMVRSRIVCLIWNSIMAFVNLAFIIIAPWRFSYVFPTEPAVITISDYLLLPLRIMIFIDIIIKFNMGYKDYSESDIVMVRSRIVCRYLLSWFVVDLVSCLPLSYAIPYLAFGYRTQMFIHLLPCIRCPRLTTIKSDVKNIIKLSKKSFILRRCANHALLFCVTMHWSCCVLYLAPMIQFYWTGEGPVGYCFFLDPKATMTSADALSRYEKAMLTSYAAFFGTGYSLFASQNADEIVAYGFVILYGCTFMVYTFVVVMKIYITVFSTTKRYHELMNQTEKYMRQRQFPVLLKKRVRKFYRYSYQERYFKEFAAMACLSEQLRDEIILDSTRRLIDTVPLFEGVPPSVVGTVLGCLKLEVYMPNDLIMAAGDDGNCMFFIACGTIAIYSLRGTEVCHLEDGAYFGEVALLMADRKRATTAIAIEITQVYRLDREDFREFIMSYHDLYERVEKVAAKRMHEALLIDQERSSSLRSTSLLDMSKLPESNK